MPIQNPNRPSFHSFQSFEQPAKSRFTFDVYVWVLAVLAMGAIFFGAYYR